MKFRRYLVLCVAVLSLGILTIGVSAALLEGDVTAVAGYCQESNLYAFVSASEWPDTVTAKAQFDGKTQPFSMEQTPSLLEETETPVSYLLLVDRSGSMRGEKNDRNPQNLVRYFADALCDSAAKGSKFAVATFDEHFNNDTTSFTDNKRAFLKDVNAIRYTAETTDLTRSVIEAIEYLDGCQRTQGELVNLVLITDGIPDGGEGRMSLPAAAGHITVSPSILFHTFGIGTSDSRSPTSLDSLAQLGRGSHTTALNSNKRDAEKAAHETAALVNGLYPLQFILNGAQSKVADAIIFLQDQVAEEGTSAQTYTKLAGVPVLSATGEVISKAESKVPESVEIPNAETPEKNSTDETEADSQDKSELDADTGKQAEGEEDDPTAGSTRSSSGGEVGQDIPKEEKSFPVMTIVIAVVAALVVLAGVYFVIRKRQTAKEPGEEIFMRLEVISGQFATKEQEFYLTDELIIGKARDCDLILKEPNLAKHCARIYLSDHIIWIEDIGSSDGVYLGGMRIYNANRLRSGDEISIGNARFQFRF